MPRLSAIDSVNPAIARVKWMLLPFRFVTWLQLGFIGWLAGEMASGGFNFNFPTSFPGGEKLPPGGIPGIHFPTAPLLLIIAIVGTLVVLFGLAFLYISCRFRFILFDSVINGRPDIGRGWAAYGPQANRFFGFSVVFGFVTLVTLALVIGLPVWRAYKRGVFHGANVLGPILVLLGSVLAMVLLCALVIYVINTAFRDFVAPLLAVENMKLGEAWSALWQLVRSEPGAFAGYLGMKIVLALAAAIIFGIAMFACIFVLLIPAALIAFALVAAGMALKSHFAIGAIIGVGAVLALAFLVALFVLIFVLQAPVVVFFESYRLYFFAGRYPKLESMLWPTLAVQQQPMAQPPLTGPGTAPAG